MAGLDTETERKQKKIGFKWGTSKSRNWEHGGNTWNPVLWASTLVWGEGRYLGVGFIYRLTLLSPEFQKQQRKNEENGGKEDSKDCCWLCG